jgi:phage shock protein PspC (stress-responsive transcriptional regulator)/predicted membrane protein
VRTTDDRVIAGVAGGLGRYFDVDPVLFRVGLIALIFLGGAGLVLYGVAWLLVPDEATGRAADARYIVRRIGAVLGVIALSLLVFAGGFWAAAEGGGTLAAVLVIVAGLVLVAGALSGGMRWLILPALSLALAVALVSAADVKLDGGVGDRDYRPTTVADVRDTYKLGMGDLVVDLRGVKLPPGDHPLHIQLGVGDARVVVPENVCVASRAQIGGGAVILFGSDHGGADVDWEDTPQAPRGTPRVVIDADIGFGALEVSHSYAGFDGRHGHGPFDRGSVADTVGNRACAGATS